MKICTITEQSHLHGMGGRELNSYKLCMGLAARGHRCTILTRSPVADITDWDAPHENVDVVCLSPESKRESWAQMLARHFELPHSVNEFDLIHMHELSAVNVWQQLAFRRLPVVISCHGTHADWIRTNLLMLLRSQSPRKAWYRLTDLCGDASFLASQRRHIGRFVDACIAFDQESARVAKVQYALSPEQVFTIHNGVDTKLFRPDLCGLTHDEYGIPKDRRVILFAGRLVMEKEPRLLIKAMKHVVQRHPEAHLLIAGDGPLVSNIHRDTQMRGLAEHVTLAGALSRERLARCMRDAALVANPTVQYGSYNTVVIESMACSKLVVLSRKGGLDQFLVSGRNCILVQPGNVMALANAIAFALESPEKVSEIGRNARELILREFSEDKEVEETIKLYRHLIETNPHANPEST